MGIYWKNIKSVKCDYAPSNLFLFKLKKKKREYLDRRSHPFPLPTFPQNPKELSNVEERERVLQRTKILRPYVFCVTGLFCLF